MLDSQNAKMSIFWQVLEFVWPGGFKKINFWQVFEIIGTHRIGFGAPGAQGAQGGPLAFFQKVQFPKQIVHFLRRTHRHGLGGPLAPQGNPRAPPRGPKVGAPGPPAGGCLKG